MSLPTAWDGYPLRKDFTDRPDFHQAVGRKIGNLDVLYTCLGKAVDPGGRAPGRAQAIVEVWRHLEPLLQDTSAAGEAIKRAVAGGNLVLQAYRARIAE